MVFDNIHLRTSSGAVGCTDKCESVRGTPIGYPNINLRMVDTVGLGESLEGTVPSDEALKMLENKFESLYCKDGIHLILFCIRKGRQSEATNQHYQAIAHELCEKKVPCLLVITRCEDDEPLGEWWTENEDAVRNQLKFDVVDAVSVTTVNNEETANDYQMSRKNLIQAIQKYSLKQSWKSKSFRTNLTLFFARNCLNRPPKRPSTKTEMEKYLQRPMNESAPKKKSFWSWWFS
ncbi:unnamed protein product [Rotaria sp. Silwood2]|nr:unnamed protein product [Rotaria sp. Silwood2]CAF2668481.1 unnamed protein product [Rotaria sp. Silwood2]CAF2945607.1 unnamed protein product [Rotaria sp. Silwood2]CAF3410895.1 unnamed protein product [Rotaria sp. Silwood2]CAF4324323.1 unnamed protein product [Rotaria sp. Silwood2]